MNGVMTPNEFRKAVGLEKFDSDFNEMKTLQAVENAIDSILVF